MKPQAAAMPIIASSYEIRMPFAEGRGGEGGIISTREPFTGFYLSSRKIVC